MKILRSNENLSIIVLVKIILFFPSRRFLKLFKIPKRIYINVRWRDIVLFSGFGSESAKAKGSNQMNLNTRDFVKLFGFWLFYEWG